VVLGLFVLSVIIVRSTRSSTPPPVSEITSHTKSAPSQEILKSELDELEEIKRKVDVVLARVHDVHKQLQIHDVALESLGGMKKMGEGRETEEKAKQSSHARVKHKGSDVLTEETIDIPQKVSQ
jgi:hypothetical protein